MRAKQVIPFSSFHRYQRADSAWADALIPEIEDHYSGAWVSQGLAGGLSVTVDLNCAKRNVGIRFECPRNSFNDVH
jgi:hypothetical protein